MKYVKYDVREGRVYTVVVVVVAELVQLAVWDGCRATTYRRWSQLSEWTRTRPDPSCQRAWRATASGTTWPHRVSFIFSLTVTVDVILCVCHAHNHALVTVQTASRFITRWLYCVEWPQYSIRLEALGYI